MLSRQKMHISVKNFPCALCVSPFDRSILIDINSDAGKELNLKDMLAQYIPFPILQGTHSHFICNNCLKKLQFWHSFILKCKEAQENFKKESGKDNLDKKVEDPKKHIGRSVISSAHCHSQRVPKAISPLKLKKSSNYCIARWCNNGNYRGVSLFRIPKERDRALTWITAAERTDLKDIKSLNNYYLCANHFSATMFTNKACNQLIRKAVPTVFPKPQFAHKMTIKEATVLNMPTTLMGVPLKAILPKVIEDNYRHESIKRKEEVAPRIHHSHLTCSVPSTEEANRVCTSNSDLVSGTSFLLKVVSSDLSSTVFKNDSDKNASCSVVTKEVPWASKLAESFDFERALPLKKVSQATLHNISCKSENQIEIQGGIPDDLSGQESVPVAVGLGDPSGDAESQERSPASKSLEKSLVLETDVVQAPLQQLSFATKSEIFEEGCDYFSQNEMYPSTAGSQDLLLPHLIHKVQKCESNFQDQSLNCDLNQDPSHSSQQGSNRDIVMSSTNSLFDLQTDDGRDGAVYMQQIENLDELMDLDNFFENR